jgi:hypothetical protein
VKPTVSLESDKWNMRNDAAARWLKRREKAMDAAARWLNRNEKTKGKGLK